MDLRPCEIIEKKLGDDLVPILDSPDDWPEWRRYAQEVMELCCVWEFCDPSIREQDLPSLEAPVEPKITSVKLSATSILDLQPDDFAKLVALVTKYKEDKEIYDWVMEALHQVSLFIVRFVAEEPYQELIAYTMKCPLTAQTVWRQLVTLTDIIQPVSRSTVLRLCDEWYTGHEQACFEAFFGFYYGFFRKCQLLKLIKPGFVPERVLFDIGYNYLIPLESQEWFKMPDFHYPVPKSMPDEKGEEMTVRTSDNDGNDGQSEEIENDRQFRRWISGWEVV
jgi:hypothetical protein